MLAVGGGGGGGDANASHRACTASTGGLAYVPFVFLAKDINLSVAVGNGGAVGVYSSNGSKVGGKGGDSSITNTQIMLTMPQQQAAGAAVVFIGIH